MLHSNETIPTAKRKQEDSVRAGKAAVQTKFIFTKKSKASDEVS